MIDPINTFIVYAREDIEIKQRLIASLNTLRHAFNFNIWHDEYIQAGEEWKSAIRTRMDQTDVFLFLMSIDFINSDFINEVELKEAIERHKANKSIVIPVIIKACQWDIDFNLGSYKFNLNELQVLPRQGLSLEEWPSLNLGLNDITRGVRVVLESITNKKLEELTLWNEIKEKASKDKCILYLDKYPQGKFTNEVKQEFSTLSLRDQILKADAERKNQEEQKKRLAEEKIKQAEAAEKERKQKQAEEWKRQAAEDRKQKLAADEKKKEYEREKLKIEEERKQKQAEEWKRQAAEDRNQKLSIEKKKEDERQKLKIEDESSNRESEERIKNETLRMQTYSNSQSSGDITFWEGVGGIIVWSFIISLLLAWLSEGFNEYWNLFGGTLIFLSLFGVVVWIINKF